MWCQRKRPRLTEPDNPASVNIGPLSPFSEANITKHATQHNGDTFSFSLSLSLFEQLTPAILALITDYLTLTNKILTLLPVSRHFYHALDAECFRGNGWKFNRLPPSSILTRLSKVSALVLGGSVYDYHFREMLAVMDMLITAPHAPLRSLSIEWLPYGDKHSEPARHAFTLFAQYPTACVNLTQLSLNYGGVNEIDLNGVNLPHLVKFDCSWDPSSFRGFNQFLVRHSTITELDVGNTFSVEQLSNPRMLPHLTRFILHNYDDEMDEPVAHLQLLINTVMTDTQCPRPIAIIEELYDDEYYSISSAILKDILFVPTLRTLNISLTVRRWNQAIHAIHDNESDQLVLSNIERMQLIVNYERPNDYDENDAEESKDLTADDVNEFIDSIGSHAQSLKQFRMESTGSALADTLMPLARLTGLQSLTQLRVLAFDCAAMSEHVVRTINPACWSHLRSLTLILTSGLLEEYDTLTKFFSSLSPTMIDIDIQFPYRQSAPYTRCFELFGMIGRHCPNVECLALPISGTDTHFWNKQTITEQDFESMLHHFPRTGNAFTQLKSLSLVSYVWHSKSMHWMDGAWCTLLSYLALAPLHYFQCSNNLVVSHAQLVGFSRFPRLRGIRCDGSTQAMTMYNRSVKASDNGSGSNDETVYTEPCTKQLTLDQWYTVLISDEPLDDWHHQQNFVMRCSLSNMRVFRTDTVHSHSSMDMDGRSAYFVDLSRLCLPARFRLARDACTIA